MHLLARMLLAACGLVALAAATHPGDDAEAAEHAIKALGALGAKFERDEKAAGRPAVTLELWNEDSEAVGDARVLAPVRDLPTLRRVALTGPFSNAHLEHLTALKGLEEVRFACNGHSIDAGLARLSGLGKLRKVDLSICYRVTGRGLGHLGKAKNLEELTTWQLPKLGDDGLEGLAGAAKLRVLDLTGSDVSDAGVKRLGKLPALERLGLSETSVTDECLKHLRGMPKLRELSLNDTEVTAAAVAAFRKDRPKVKVNFRPLPKGAGDPQP